MDNVVLGKLLQLWYYLNVTEKEYDNVKHLPGFSANEIETGNVDNVVTEFEQNGNDFTWTTVLPIKTVTNTFTAGKRCELESMQGLNQQVIHNILQLFPLTTVA